MIFFTHIFQHSKLNCFVFTFLLIIVCSHSVNAQIVVRIPDNGINVWQIVETKDGKVWIATDHGAFRVDGNKATRITDKNSGTYKIIETKDGKVWLLARQGLFLVDGEKTTRIFDNDITVRKIIVDPKNETVC